MWKKFNVSGADILWNNVPMTLRTGEEDDSFTHKGGRPWHSGEVYYTNLPQTIKSRLPMYGTTDVNTGHSNILYLPKPFTGYLFREPGWSSVPLDGWELISTGRYLGPKYGDVNLYRREFPKGGEFTIDNNSGMYLFAEVEAST